MIADKDYLEFLRVELPKLKEKKIPFLSRTRKARNDTLKYVLKQLKNPKQSEGLFLEFGVWEGTTINMIADVLKRSTIYGFDSFHGFPDDGRDDWEQDFSLDGKLPETRENVRLIKGYFDESLPSFVKEHSSEHITFMHIDCDIYSSTKSIFDNCAPLINSGCIIVFDELLHYSRFLNNEMLALYEFVKNHNYEIEWLGIRNKVMDIDTFIETYVSMGPMKNWRKNGYYQEVALKLITKE